MSSRHDAFNPARFLDIEIQRRALNFEALTELGPRVIIVWECDLKKHPSEVPSDIHNRLLEA